MNVLVIPDIHLKPEIFHEAEKTMEKTGISQAVCLMDIADDFGQEFNTDLYERTYDAAILFQKNHPNTLWCYGNHDLSYLYNLPQSRYSIVQRMTVVRKLALLANLVSKTSSMQKAHRIDIMIFSHAGISEQFVKDHGIEEEDIDEIIASVNRIPVREMWNYESPLWLRPKKRNVMIGHGKYLHVVGHTPVETICRGKDIIYTDTFSSCSDGSPYGNRSFLILDTENIDVAKIVHTD